MTETQKNSEEQATTIGNDQDITSQRNRSTNHISNDFYYFDDAEYDRTNSYCMYC